MSEEKTAAQSEIEMMRKDCIYAEDQWAKTKLELKEWRQLAYDRQAQVEKLHRLIVELMK